MHSMSELLRRFLKNHRLNLILGLLLALPCLIYLMNARWEGTGWRYSIHSDGKGYYAYLPALFIYGDSEFRFARDYEQKYYDPGNYVNFTSKVNDITVNKYWSGTALMMLPFFCVADFLAHLLDYPDDGYSFPYQASVGIAAVFWLLFGCLCLLQLLTRYFLIHPFISIASILLFVFSSNLFYYTVAEPSMSHVYSFAILSGFLYFLSQYIRLNSISALWASGIFAGMLLLIRPTNVLLLLSFLILFKNFKDFRSFFKVLFSSLFFPLTALLLCGLVLFVQFYYFHRISGKWWIDSYVNENFNFLQPELFNFLLSYRKGLWIYTPIAFLALLGLLPLFKKSSFVGLAVSTAIFIYYYVLSSWWMWFYGGSFGMRAAIDAFPLLIILLAHFIQFLSPKIRIPFALLLLACFTLNLIQTYQYTHWILPWDNMNKEKYWKIFLQTSNDYIGVATPDN